MTDPALRRRELAELTGAMTRPPALILVEGEAGVGKSRLVQEFLGSMAGRHAPPALVGVCPPVPESLTLGRSWTRCARPATAWRGCG